jgi:hypothetical protein
VTARHAASMVFYTDGFLIDGCAGFAFRTGEGGFGYKTSSPAGIFTAEVTALFVTLRNIGEVIQPPEKCLILTDCLSSVVQLRLCYPEKYHIGLIHWCRNVSRCVSRCVAT